MLTLHEKCTHPRLAIQHFGQRRRRCRLCGKTWSVHARRRGRKSRRTSQDSLKRLLLAGVPTSQLARSHGCSTWTMQRRCQTAMRRLADQPHQLILPDGPLVLIADALRLKHHGCEHALYSMALKPAHRNLAFLCEPVLLEGRESAGRWREAIGCLPELLRQRIAAAVTDGFPGAGPICSDYGWTHQRCHWHMLMMFRGSIHLEPRPRTLLRRIRNVACRAAWLALNVPDSDRLQDILGLMTALIPMVPKRARKLPGIIRRFVIDVDAGRTYLAEPQLGLPVTTAVIESLHSRIRSATHRIHSPAAIGRRAACLVRLRPTMVCEARIHTQN